MRWRDWGRGRATSSPSCPRTAIATTWARGGRSRTRPFTSARGSPRASGAATQQGHEAFERSQLALGVLEHACSNERGSGVRREQVEQLAILELQRLLLWQQLEHDECADDVALQHERDRGGLGG